MSLHTTPAGNRLHIGIFGRRNVGKSSLINALTGQNIALTSEIAGSTTDPVYKAMEISGLGPCMLVDTAGWDDTGDLGTLRVERTRAVAAQVDVAILVICDLNLTLEAEWMQHLDKRPVLVVWNKADQLTLPTEQVAAHVKEILHTSPLFVSAKQKTGITTVLEALIRKVPQDFDAPSLTGGFVRPNDVVLLVMPQDIQAPKGRLILPQVQTIRDLLDHQCTVVGTTAERFSQTLQTLVQPPDWIITDSQVFPLVYAQKPAQSRLTSFSILMAASKGDIHAFVAGAQAIDHLTASSRVLIAEACTHAPKEEDIGRVKIPKLLRKKVGESLEIDFVRGTDFPSDLSKYDLVIHCGACMFHRRLVYNRLANAQMQHIPMTNYGIALAKLNHLPLSELVPTLPETIV